jgi:type IV/VI secretion system ImpK/VasF family protein
MTMDNPTAPVTRTLEEVTADWFAFLISYRRNIKSMPADIEWVRERLVALLAAMDGECQRDPNLQFLFKEARYALVYFADEVLLSCRWAGEAAWAADLLESHVFGTQHGGQDFFTRLGDASMKDPQLLGVYYKCLCLGFRGIHVMQPLRLREEREKLYHRLVQTPIPTPRFCPQAYANTENRDHVRPPLMGTGVIAALAAVFMLTVYLVGSSLFRMNISELLGAADKVVHPAGPEADK